MSAACLAALSRDVGQLFDEYYGFSAYYDRIKEAVARIMQPDGAEPFFWGLLYWTTGSGPLRRLIAILKKHGVDLNERNGTRQTCLHRLVQWDESEEPGWRSAGVRAAIRILVAAGADPSVCDERGNGLLIPALCSDVSPEMIALLAELTSDSLNARNQSGLTALRVAIRSLNEDAIRVLLVKGANPFLTDDQYGNILHWVIESVERYDSSFTPYLTEILIDYHKALRDGKRKCDGQMPIMLLCSNRFVLPVPDDLFRMLIPSKAAINDVCDEGHSCLSHVIMSHFRDEKLSRISELVDAGAAITAEVLTAAVNSNCRVLKKLLELGAVPCVQHLKDCVQRPEPDGNAAFRVLLNIIKPQSLRDSFPEAACAYLMHFVQWHLSEESIDADFIVKLLKDYELDVNHNNEKCGTLLHILCHRQTAGSVALFQRLLQEFGDELRLDLLAKRDPLPFWMSEPDENLTTPLQIAIEMSSYPMAAALVQNYASTKNLNLTQMRSVSSDSDSHYYQLIQMLKLDGVQTAQLDEKVKQLQEKYPDFDVLTKPEPVKSLAELSCLTLRRNFTRSDALHLVHSLHLRSKVEDYLFLRHVRVVQFPKQEIGAIFLDEYDDEDDDDDDDFFDDASDMIDDWDPDHYDHYDQADAYIFFQ